MSEDIESNATLIRWILGVLSGLLLLLATWMWQITSQLSTAERSLDRYTALFQSHEGSINHLRAHADETQIITTKAEGIALDLLRRMAIVEASIAQGLIYSVKDGELERETRKTEDSAIRDKIRSLEENMELRFRSIGSKNTGGRN